MGSMRHVGWALNNTIIITTHTPQDTIQLVTVLVSWVVVVVVFGDNPNDQ